MYSTLKWNVSSIYFWDALGTVYLLATELKELDEVWREAQI